MSKNIKKTVAAVFGIVLMVAIVGFYGFANAKKEAKTQEPDTWYFNGSDINQATTATNWSQTPNPNCGSGDALPCELNVTNAPNQAALQTFLNGKTGVQIRDDYASSTRD